METYRIYFMPDAIKDLENIYLYIYEQSGFPNRAWRYMEKLKSKCKELEIFSIRGQLRNDLMELQTRRYTNQKSALFATERVSINGLIIFKD